MAFNTGNLSVLAYANGFTLWHYRSATDTDAAMAGAGYFNDASDLLRPGDMLALNGAGGSAALVRVAANRRGAVAIGFTTDWETQAAVADATGGTTVDAEARKALGAVIAALEQVGILAAA